MATSKGKILIVDDNKYAADALARLLEHDGYTTQIAYDGETGLELAPPFSPDAVVLDIELPDKNGYEVAKELRERLFSQALLIALTGYGQKEDKLKAQESGFDHHLTKPILVADIEKLVRQHIKRVQER